MLSTNDITDIFQLARMTRKFCLPPVPPLLSLQPLISCKELGKGWSYTSATDTHFVDSTMALCCSISQEEEHPGDEVSKQMASPWQVLNSQSKSNLSVKTTPLLRVMSVAILSPEVAKWYRMKMTYYTSRHWYYSDKHWSGEKLPQSLAHLQYFKLFSFQQPIAWIHTQPSEFMFTT